MKKRLASHLNPKLLLFNGCQCENLCFFLYTEWLCRTVHLTIKMLMDLIILYYILMVMVTHELQWKNTQIYRTLARIRQGGFWWVVFFLFWHWICFIKRNRKRKRWRIIIINYQQAAHVLSSIIMRDTCSHEVISLIFSFYTWFRHFGVFFFFFSFFCAKSNFHFIDGTSFHKRINSYKIE